MVSKWVITYLYMEYIGVITHLLTSCNIQVVTEPSAFGVKLTMKEQQEQVTKKRHDFARSKY